jgi:DNA-binding MarR family transcriptional regulator
MNGLHDRIGYRVARLARLIDARFEERISQFGITRMMWCVLSGAGLEGVTTPSGLADHIGIERSAVSRLLRKMEAMDLIERGDVANDGRGVEIRLTTTGLRIARESHDFAEEVNEHFAAKLDTDDLERFNRIIDVMSAGETSRLTRL